jgi:hypothetical protein
MSIADSERQARMAALVATVPHHGEPHEVNHEFEDLLLPQYSQSSLQGTWPL